MPTVAITLLSKPGCHLCDDARAVVTAVFEELSAAPSTLDLSLDEMSILDDAELTERYFEEIPVVLINGAVHNIWRVDSARFRRAVLDAAQTGAAQTGAAQTDATQQPKE